MTRIINSGLLSAARYHLSPHCDERPDPTDISLLVVHGISLPAGVFGGDAVIDLFSGTLDCSVHPSFSDLVGVRVSSHLFIRRGGEIIQFVPFQKRAWHAGQSTFAERSNCNDFSIGIELEGTDEIPYTAPQYAVLAEVVALLQRSYPAITPDRVVGHSTIAPGRKTDPGPAFDWSCFTALLAEHNEDLSR